MILLHYYQHEENNESIDVLIKYITLINEREEIRLNPY